MNSEPKVTDRAAFVALWHNGELLVLQSRKWQMEGTPYLLPGGGCGEAESLEDCALRELNEECGIVLLRSDLSYFSRHDTQWSACHFFEHESVYSKLFVYAEPKLFGYEWWNFEKDRVRIEALKPFMMPGLLWYLQQKGLL